MDLIKDGPILAARANKIHFTLISGNSGMLVTREEKLGETFFLGRTSSLSLQETLCNSQLHYTCDFDRI